MKHIKNLIFAACLLSTQALWARDICVQDNYNAIYVFKNIESLKPSSAAPLYGFALKSTANGTAAPLTGTVTVLANGRLNYGFYLFNMAPIGLDKNNSYFVMVSNADKTTWVGKAGYEHNGDGKKDGDLVLTSYDCKEIKAYP